MKAFWKQRNNREQALLMVLGLTMGVFFVWLGLVGPAQQFRDRAQGQLNNAYADLLVVEDLAGQLQGLSSIETQEGAVQLSVRTAAMTLAQEMGLSITRIQPFEDGRISIWIDEVDSAALFTWLQRLEAEYAHVPVAANVNRNASGQGVQAQLSFQEEIIR